jgi:hypothetical protein
MHTSPRRRSLVMVFLAILSLSTVAQVPCSKIAIANASSQLNDIQHRLSSIKLEDMDTEVPPSIQQDTTLLKNRLAHAVEAVLACNPTDAQPSALETSLAQALKANVSEPNNTFDAWGSDLHISVDQTSNPHFLLVRLQYAIERGDDNMLLVFAPQQGHWSEKLLWQSPAYKDDSGAFGDFFLTATLSGTTPDDWRIVVAHGKHWCTSRFSGFGIDVLAPTSDPAHPQVLWHTDRGYSRSDFTPTLKASGDTFELRLHADEMSFDIETAFERTVIYRYRISGTTVTRLEPIATTGRGFVEEWLSMPCPEAEDQSLTTHSEALQRIHHQYETSYPKDSIIYTSWTAGPLRSCATAGQFQVVFDAQLTKMVPGKPGGEQDPPIPYYFQIEQIGSGYEMESTSTASDLTCICPDLMAKPAVKAH